MVLMSQLSVSLHFIPSVFIGLMSDFLDVKVHEDMDSTKGQRC